MEFFIWLYLWAAAYVIGGCFLCFYHCRNCPVVSLREKETVCRLDNRPVFRFTAFVVPMARPPVWNSCSVFHPAAASPLLLAVGRGHPETVDLLLEAGANPVADVEGWTPLMQAAYLGKFENVTEDVKLLLTHGADPPRARAWGYRSAAELDATQAATLVRRSANAVRAG